MRAGERTHCGRRRLNELACVGWNQSHSEFMYTFPEKFPHASLIAPDDAGPVVLPVVAAHLRCHRLAQVRKNVAAVVGFPDVNAAGTP